MIKRKQFLAGWLVCVLGALVSSQTYGQAGSEDDFLDTIRASANPGKGDQRRTLSWAQDKVTKLKAAVVTDALKALRDYRAFFNSQYNNTGNNNDFRQMLANQITAVAVSEFQAETNPVVSQTLARVLLDFGVIETLPGLLAGLSSTDQSTRYLCANALAKLTIAASFDQSKAASVIAGLQQAGTKESNAVVLSRIYMALSIKATAQIPAASDAILAIMDSRLVMRKSGQAGIDRAEVEALAYFQSSGVAGALSQPQRDKLVTIVATFLRMDAEAFSKANITPDHLDHLIRRMIQEEESLVALAGSSANHGNVTKEIEEGGHLRRNQVLQQAYLWVGDSTSKTAGSLNAAPWNVPLGAP